MCKYREIFTVFFFLRLTVAQCFRPKRGDFFFLFRIFYCNVKRYSLHVYNNDFTVATITSLSPSSRRRSIYSNYSTTLCAWMYIIYLYMCVCVSYIGMEKQKTNNKNHNTTALYAPPHAVSKI